MDIFDNEVYEGNMPIEMQKEHTEEKLRDFYRKKLEMERLLHNLQMLCRHKAEILQDINDSNITLEVAMPGVDYSKERVQSSNLASPQERAVDKAFAELEKKLNSLEAEILDKKNSVRELEREISDMEFLVGQLNDEARRFVDMRYRDRKTIKVVGRALHLSDRALWRLRNDVLEDITKWLTK